VVQGLASRTASWWCRVSAASLSPKAGTIAWLASRPWRPKDCADPEQAAGLSRAPLPAADGGAWLALFAPRNRLIEFTLLEDAYRTQMMREVPREYWIAPALASGTTFSNRCNAAA